MSELSIHQIENIKKEFATKPLEGKSLPNSKSVSDGQPFYLLGSDGVYVEHIMFKGKWMRKEINASDQIILVEV